MSLFSELYRTRLKQKKNEMEKLQIKKTRRFFMYLFLIIVDFLEYFNDFYIKINLTTNHYYKLLWSSEPFEVKYNTYRIWNPHRISKSKKNKIFKSALKQEIGLLWSSESFEVKYNIGFGISIKQDQNMWKQKKYEMENLQRKFADFLCIYFIFSLIS